MPASTPVLALLLYPFLHVLPLNFVRLQWGFRNGVAPMPPEVQERAERVDRAVFFGMHLTLLTLVVLLIHATATSPDAVGLTANNWVSATALGILVSLVPLALTSLTSRSQASEWPRNEAESRGPLSTWCGLIALDAFSNELWRCLCIVILIRGDVSAWLAVLLATVAFGAPKLYTNTARALGRATAGGVAGYLFVKTGSLLAPLAMSLMLQGFHLYRSRHLASRAPTCLPVFKCPLCSERIEKAQNPAGRCFACPGCGQKLRFAMPQDSRTTVLSFVLGYFFAALALYTFKLDIVSSMLLFPFLGPVFAFVFALAAVAFRPGIPTLEIYYDPTDPEGRLFRF